MGAWGTKLYQDDLAEEVRDYYKEQLHRGKRGEEITQELLVQYQSSISDPDDAPIFWFALADTQWNLGRLESYVKEQALYYINDGSDLKRWEDAGTSYIKSRTKIIAELKEKLLSKQPDEKKVSQYKLYHCDWKIGDVYAYQLSGDYAKEKEVINKYLFFVKVDEMVWHPGHIVPVVYFYWIMADRLLSIEELKNIDYIPQFFTPNAYNRNPKLLKQYSLSLLSTSVRVIPKKQLTFVGSMEKVMHIDNENPTSYQVSWKDFEKYILDNFKIWNDFSPHY